jgi:hypothetical protein
MATSRIPIKKPLLAAVVAGLLALGVGGATAAGAAGATGGAPSGGTHKVECTGVRTDLARMRHRQAELSAKVAGLRASTARAANDRKGHRASTIRSNLLHWEKIQAHRINARFLRRESRFAALAAGICQADATSTTAPASASTTAPTNVPSTSTTTVPGGTTA